MMLYPNSRHESEALFAGLPACTHNLLEGRCCAMHTMCDTYMHAGCRQGPACKCMATCPCSCRPRGHTKDTFNDQAVFHLYGCAVCEAIWLPLTGIDIPLMRQLPSANVVVDHPACACSVLHHMATVQGHHRGSIRKAAWSSSRSFT